MDSPDELIRKILLRKTPDLLRYLYDRTQSVDGWLSLSEALMLWNLARDGAGQGAIVEIGSWKGKSTIWLAWGSKSVGGEKIVSIDPHTGNKEHQPKSGSVWTYNEFIQNLKNCEADDWVIPIVSTSQKVARQWSESLRLVFVDGSHEYKDVKQDFHVWFARLRNGGVIALHDSFFSGWKGPTKVVEQFMIRNRFAAHVGFLGSMTFCQKVRWDLLSRVRNMFLFPAVRLASTMVHPSRGRLIFWLAFLFNATDTKLLRLSLRVRRQAANLARASMV